MIRSSGMCKIAAPELARLHTGEKCSATGPVPRNISALTGRRPSVDNKPEPDGVTVLPGMGM